MNDVMDGIYARGDRIMKRFILVHFFVALALAPFYDTWLVTLLVAGAAALMFFASAALLPRSFVTRCVAGIALQTFVALHIYQLHGLAEMHFFFFTAFTMMIVYQDGKSMWPGALLIIGQHITFAVLTNSGAELSFFEDSSVGVTKLGFHFGIALAQVALCGYWATLLRRQTLKDAFQQAELQESQSRLHAAYERERRIAETLQRSLLLTAPEDTFPGLAVKTFYEPALSEASVGGDFYDTFTLPDGRVALVVGDASGKGLRAAARTAEIKYALRAFVRECPRPAQALARLNDFVCEAQRLDGREEASFVSLSLAVVDTATGQAVFSAAGAEPPLLLRAEGTAEEIPIPGVLLGVQPGQAYDVQARHFRPGDTLLLMTDGLTEARGRDRALLGYDGVTRIASQCLGAGSLQEFGEAVLGCARAFAGGSLQDDACLLIARRRETTIEAPLCYTQTKGEGDGERGHHAAR